MKIINILQNFLIFSTIISLGLGFIYIIRLLLIKKVQKIIKEYDISLGDFFLKSVNNFLIPILIIFLINYTISYIGINKYLYKIINICFIVLKTYFITHFIVCSFNYLINSYLKIKSSDYLEKHKQIKGMIGIFSIVIWSFSIIFMFNNIGYNVTTILTGLGIGGIAVALAAQKILGDLFNYFVIFFDRPFEIGDFIIVNNKKGHISSIGIKSTRINSIDGESIIISNTDLTNSIINNYRKVKKRRAKICFWIDYDIGESKIDLIYDISKNALKDYIDISFERCCFVTYDEIGLNFEVVIYIKYINYHYYINHVNYANIAIYKAFQKNGIKFSNYKSAFLIQKTQL
ncbi:MAG: mechanosensitive ion channel [Bacteroides sp.]|nr:MAG: mechanosensitive ion channel [Bacteroides sp.]